MQGGGFKYFCYVHPYLGKISYLSNIFQMGWNHQLEYIYVYTRLFFFGMYQISNNNETSLG